MPDSVAQPSITIIIDDLGNSLADGKRAINLPGPVTYAILPGAKYSGLLANYAHKHNKEVMLHMPMGNTQDRPLGPTALTLAQSRDEFVWEFQKALASLPHIKGVNNHMGSAITADVKRMQWLMQAISSYPLYFVDSRTTVQTVAARTAEARNLPNLERDVFLDHDASPAAIDDQFRRLIQLAKKQGSAVAIGHPYPSTLGYLEAVLPRLNRLGIRLISPSALLLTRRDRNTDVRQKAIMSAAILPNSDCQIVDEGQIMRVNCS